MVDISQKVHCDEETIRKEVKGRLERIRGPSFRMQVCNHGLFLTTWSFCWTGRTGSKTKAGMVALSSKFPSQWLYLWYSIAQGPETLRPQGGQSWRTRLC